jgi:hypothetical protein
MMRPAAFLPTFNLDTDQADPLLVPQGDAELTVGAAIEAREHDHRELRCPFGWQMRERLVAWIGLPCVVLLRQSSPSVVQTLRIGGILLAAGRLRVVRVSLTVSVGPIVGRVGVVGLVLFASR